MLEELLGQELEKAEAVFAKLIELAQEKRRILLAGPKREELAGGLERIVSEEEAALAQLRGLERREAMRSLELSGLPPEAHERLQRLFQLAEELGQINSENAQILKRFQDYVDFMAGLLEKRAGSKTYGESKGGMPTIGISRISRQV